MRRLLFCSIAGYALLSLVCRLSYNRAKAIEDADPDTWRWWTTREKHTWP